MQEWDASWWGSISQFLTLADGGKLQMQTKGGYAWMAYELLIITAPFAPDAYWKDDPLQDHLKRRFYEGKNVVLEIRRPHLKADDFIEDAREGKIIYKQLKWGGGAIPKTFTIKWSEEFLSDLEKVREGQDIDFGADCVDDPEREENAAVEWRAD